MEFYVAQSFYNGYDYVIEVNNNYYFIVFITNGKDEIVYQISKTVHNSKWRKISHKKVPEKVMNLLFELMREEGI